VSTLAFAIFWVSSALLVWVYVLYPLLALAYGRLRPLRLTVNASPPSVVTVGVAAHDGAAEIEQRLMDIVAQTVPTELELIVASDGSRDDTADVVRRLAMDDPRVKLIELPRSGQSAAQAAIFEAARGEVVVLTDIETRFAPGCLAALIAPFADPLVGCATGVLRWRFDAATDTARHEGLYWRYEQTVRAWESRAGWLSAGTGALLAVRRSLYRPVSADASLDQMLPLIARDQGARVLVTPEALGSDRGTASLGDQFTSRTRIATQGIAANLRMSLHVLPWRRPGSFLAIWSHKILRWATPFLGLCVTLGGVGLWLDGRSVAYLLPVGLAALVGLLALVGYLGQRVGRTLPLTGFPLTIVAVNLAFALAWLNVLLRRRVGAWDKGSV
jgi:cellulose synthase/poly-beta-1,6-N-acetylglucosamine synthase-like glycosyltransferase